jgi:hypothetical protein
VSDPIEKPVYVPGEGLKVPDTFHPGSLDEISTYLTAVGMEALNGDVEAFVLVYKRPGDTGEVTVAMTGRKSLCVALISLASAKAVDAFWGGDEDLDSSERSE